jgi:hypothetical protein
MNAVTVRLKTSVFWEITPCSLLKGTQRFVGNVYIFRVEEQAKQQTNLKHATSR